MVLSDRQNQQTGETLRQNLHTQVLQLQQNQQLWLQSQYYLLNTLAKSPADEQNFQSFIWGYYQRNPSIWAVNLVKFDGLGRTESKSVKPGCLQPEQMLGVRFDDFLVPRITSCRIEDRALLEIAGPVATDAGPVVLLVSMDYFDFLQEFASVTGRKLQRDAAVSDAFRFYQVEAGNLTITIPVGSPDSVYGELRLAQPSLSFWPLFGYQSAIVLLILLLATLLALLLLRRLLIDPLYQLAEEMRMAAMGSLPKDTGPPQVIRPGLASLHRYFRQLQESATIDPVTGLNNRVIFEDRLAQAIREGKRSGRKYALVMIDIRGLDDLVQKRGQFIVDSLLRRVADHLRESLRESDHLSRFERGLFALLLEVPEHEQLNNLVEKIYLSLIQRHRVTGREFELEVFIGIAIYPDHALDAESLYQNASTALVAAERSEWPIEFYQDVDSATDVSGFTLIQSLRRAIERDELKLVFQPVVELQSYRTVYLEALLRWKDPERHDVSIEQTIRLAEQNHLIKSLTNWIIESACQFVSQSNLQDVAVGINLSMIDLHDHRLPERIGSYLEQYQVKPAQIVIEITEGQIMQEPERVIEVLSHLGVMGLSLSIDDFGTGQASLTYLKELPVEKLKIDQSFVRDIVSNPDDQLIVRATIELAHTLDLKVVAEGVETLAVCELLAEMSCDHVQGYYISRPLEADQVSTWLETSIKPDLVRQGR
jgi:diguanylate cyclase (GGDEF)-like protein